MKTPTLRNLALIALAAIVLASSLIATPGVASASSAPAIGQAAPVAQSVCTYKVQYGDTLFSIAARNHTTVWELLRLNRLSIWSWLYAGSTLRVPCGNDDGGSANCSYRATYVADITVPDGSQVTAGSNFPKIWRVRNTGTCVWGPGHALHSLVWVGGTQMGAPNPVAIDTLVYPGHEVDLVVPMVAPKLAGRYLSEWKLKVDGGPQVGVGSANVPLYVDFYVSSSLPATTVRIQFAPGTDSQIANGRSFGGEVIRYVVSARRGQVMEARLIGIVPTPATIAVSGADGQVLLPEGNGQTSYYGTLPRTQDYYITVTPTVSRTIDFALQVTIR